MIPSNRIFARERVLFPLQEQLLTGFPQPGQIRPDSVEYTKREVSVIGRFPQIERYKKMYSPLITGYRMSNFIRTMLGASQPQLKRGAVCQSQP